jgi:hypothetical protein
MEEAVTAQFEIPHPSFICLEGQRRTEMITGLLAKI